jgi:hypothetical protein
MDIAPDSSIRLFLLRTLALAGARLCRRSANGMSLLGCNTPGYAAAIGQVGDFVRDRAAVPVWLIGTSQSATGAIGAALDDKARASSFALSVTARSRDTLFDAEARQGWGAGADRRKQRR